LSGSAATAHLYLPLVLKPSISLGTSLWRFGVAKARRPVSDYENHAITSLRFGWYVDYGTNASAVPNLGMEYVPMVHVKQWKLKPDGSWTTWCHTCPYVTPYTYTVSPPLGQLPSFVASRPGLLWAIGNEIERRDWDTGGQDEILPELYAQAYHEVYTTIKRADSTAQVANGSMVAATPLRLQYLERVWNAYTAAYGQPMPVDVWNLHIFILPEQLGGWGAGIPAGLSETQGATYCLVDRTDNRNFSLAWEQIVNFRIWMLNHGQRNKPLILTEYGVSFPDWALPGQFTPPQVRDSYMYPSFDYFLTVVNGAIGYPADGNRLVQRWIWYSLDDDSRSNNYGSYVQNYNGNLFSTGYELAPTGLTLLGIYWQQYVQTLPAGSGRPYAPALQQPALSSPKGSNVPTRQEPNVPPAERVDCGDRRSVRLLFYESAPRAPILATGAAAPPRLVREATICLDHPAP
jgi:hypothetical protein